MIMETTELLRTRVFKKRVCKDFMSALLWQFELVQSNSQLEFGTIEPWAGTYASGLIASVVIKESDNG